MLILFDHGTPRGLAAALSGHTVVTAFEKGWERLANGDLLKVAEEDRFELFLTTDRRLQYQQNLKDRRISILVLTGSTKWSQVRLRMDEIAATVNSATPGSYREIEIPFAAAKASKTRKPE